MESRFRNNLSAICACRENIPILWCLFILTKVRATVKSVYAFLGSRSAPLGRTQCLIPLALRKQVMGFWHFNSCIM